jgi:hypothetical protein
MSTPFEALALARAIGRADRYTVDLLLDGLGITSSEKAAELVGHLCGLLIGLARLHEARTGESWEDLLTKLAKVATEMSRPGPANGRHAVAVRPVPPAAASL